MLRNATFLFLLSIVPAVGAAQTTTRLQIFYSGAPAGENVYVSQPDGMFSSKTQLTIGSLKITSTMSGKFAGARLTEYHAEAVDPTGAKSTIHFDGRQLKVMRGATETTLDAKFADPPYFGNLHPQICTSVLSAVDWSKKSPQKFKCFSPDVGAVLSPTLTPLHEKVTPKGSAKLFRLTIGAVEATYGLSDSGQVVLMDVPGQKLRFVVAGWEALVKDPLAAYPELSQPTYKFVTEKGVSMKTRDGVNLVADVIRPDAPGKFPVILERTPYGRGGSATDGPFYATRGYAFVSQDCRGRYDSDGEWNPFVHERKDGFDTVQWIASQPWCDGNVGMIGGSYGGIVQWAAAVENPPALKCIVPQVSPPDAMLNLPYDNGVFFLYGAVWWAKIVAGKTADMSSILSKLPHPENFGELPLSKLDQAVLGRKVPFYETWLKQEKAADWTGFNYESDLSRVTIPVLHISGWFDGDEPGTMLNWEILRNLGRKNQWLVYGAWSHLFNSTSKLGDYDFGPTDMIDLDSVYLRWFDTWLKGKSVGWERQPKVRAFVMGANKWVESSDWPLSSSKLTTLYLAADGTVEGKLTKGTMQSTPPRSQPPSTFKYDPHYAAIGTAFTNPDIDAVSFNLTIPVKAPGIVIFKSAPFSTPTTVSGPIQVDLRFSTSAQNTDIFANLVDIDSKGNYRAFSQAGKIRGSYIGGLDKPRALTPGKIYAAKFRIWDAAYQLGKGHRLGLIITSSGFPKFSRNLGTIDPIATATRMVIQNQKLFHDAKNPSSLTFRVTTP